MVESSDAALSVNAPEKADDDELSREEKLKQLLLRQAMENPEAIRELLKTAPESLREILLWVLEVIEAGYDEALDNLE